MMDDSSYRLIFYLDKKDEIYHYSSRSILKLVKLQTVWLRSVVKYEKYSPVKLANFDYLSITRRKMHHYRLNDVFAQKINSGIQRSLLFPDCMVIILMSSRTNSTSWNQFKQNDLLIVSCLRYVLCTFGRQNLVLTKSLSKPQNVAHAQMCSQHTSVSKN